MINIHYLDSFTFESGYTFKNIPIAYSTWGKLNDTADNVIVVCHSLTSNTLVDEWWSDILGPNKGLDTNKYFVICFNVLGSPYGSFSPITKINGDTNTPLNSKFPVPSIRDNVKAHKLVLDQLGINKVFCAIGGSLGGMQTLEWANQFSEYIAKIIPIGVGAWHSPWCIAWSDIQRQMIMNDPNWSNGFYSNDNPPSDGLGLARQTALISYRSQSSFQDRFKRNKTDDIYDVSSYLMHHHDIFNDRFDANCYLALLDSMDTHDLSHGTNNCAAVLKNFTQDALVIGIKSDILYPPEEQEFLANHIPRAELKIMDFSHGHDTFLIETDEINQYILSWL